MPNHHIHLHQRRQTDWSDLVDNVESVADNLNPFADATPTLQAKSPKTVFATVYTTLQPTFEGEVGGYTTVNGDGEDSTATAAAVVTTTQEQQTQATTTAKAQVATTAETSAQTAAHTSEAEETSVAKTTAIKGSTTDTLPESIASTSLQDATETSLALASSTSSASQTTHALANSASITDSSASATSTSSADSSDSGSSSAAKAGIAIGVLGGLLVVGLLIFFLFNKRKKQLERQQLDDDEKINGPSFGNVARAESVHTTRTSATAPRLSLRPASQFNPTFNERRSSKGAGAMLAAAAKGHGGQHQQMSPVREKGGSLWERPSTGNSTIHENPFGNDAERAYTPTGNELATAQNQPSNPFNSPEDSVGMAETTNSHSGAAGAAVAGAAAGAAATAILARKASTRQANAPPPMDFTQNGPPSPAGTEFSMNSVAPGQSPGPSKSAAAIAEAGGPAATGVHRVQLDFAPTMNDEMELRAGQLVRMLHEYDDGWALCIRLDRSRQGVVPRTCLSTRPVKPRPTGPGARTGPPVNPQGPPRGPPRGPAGPPGQRPMTPQGRPMTPQGGPMHARPESPMRPGTAGGRPQSPVGPMRPYSPAGGRPASPAQARPMSPGPRAQSPGPRSQSPSGMNRRHSPPGPSPMNPNNGAGPQPQQYRPAQGPVGRKPVPGQAY
ncbi:hypothetical protein F5Y15DRAFT_222827 [Xylariaceae sp. FL0016]|nr:hypothetical protein F5Y15DRAFT_222827 [Xylariaceae sp. FL0016]